MTCVKINLGENTENITFHSKGCGKGYVYLLLCISNPLLESLEPMHIL